MGITIINKGKVSFFLFFLITSFLPLLHANEQTALDYYQRAEIAFKANQLETAIDFYNKAILEHSTDGEIVVNQIMIKKILSQGRTAKLVKNYFPETALYYPNARLEEVKKLVELRHRTANPPVLWINWVSLQEPTGDNVLDGGESGSIAVEIQNKGLSVARGINLTLHTQATKGLTFIPNTIIKHLSPGQSIISTIDIIAAKNIPQMEQHLTVFAETNDAHSSNELDIILFSKPHQTDEIIVAKMDIEDLSGDGLIEPTEVVTVKATIANTGKGVSSELTAHLNLGNNVFFAPGSNGSLLLGKIYPGGSKNVQFSFLSNHDFYHNQSIPVLLKITDQKSQEKASSDLGLSINVPNKKVVVNVFPRNQNASMTTSQLVDVDISIPKGKKKNKSAVAVVIGNRNYRKAGLPRVEYAQNDSKIMKEYLIKTMGYDENNILYFEDATTANFAELFGTAENHKGKIFNHVKPNISDVFIYYSGHGAPDIKSRNSYFVPVDADPNYIALSGYSLDLFYKNMAKIHAKQITIVLDTCFSGNSDGGYLLGNISPAMVNLREKNHGLKNSIVFSSTRLDQVSVWFHEKKHSLFTYYFLKGLSGAADKNQDLSITSTELGDYVKNTVPYQARRINGFEQDPRLIQNNEINLVEFAKPKQHLIKVMNSY